MNNSTPKFADRAKLYYNQHMISPEQCRAARAILNWTQRELHEAAQVGWSTIKSFEKNETTPHFRNMLSIRETFERSGIEFVFEGDHPIGVRYTLKALKK